MSTGVPEYAVFQAPYDAHHLGRGVVGPVISYCSRFLPMEDSISLSDDLRRALTLIEQQGTIGTLIGILLITSRDDDGRSVRLVIDKCIALDDAASSNGRTRTMHLSAKDVELYVVCDVIAQVILERSYPHAA